jgi:hypothetical protein
MVWPFFANAMTFPDLKQYPMTFEAWKMKIKIPLFFRTCKDPVIYYSAISKISIDS